MYEYFKVRLGKLGGQLRQLPRTLALVWAAAARWTAAWLALLVVQGLLPLATVYLSRALVNALVASVKAGATWPSMKPALVSAGMLAGVVLATQLLRSATIWISTVQAELTSDYITGLIHRKSATVDLAFYESPECYDHLHRARAEGSYRPVAVIENLGSLFQNGITLAAMFAVLIHFGPIVPLVLLATTIPALYVVVRSGQRRYLWNRERTPLERRAWYYDWLLTTGENAAEIRLFGLGGHFCAAYQDLRCLLRRERLQLARQQGIAELLAGTTSLLMVGAAMGLMVWRAMLGLMPLGDLALFYQAFNQGLGLTRSLLENVGRLYENSLFLGNLFEFLGLESKLSDSATRAAIPELTDGIRFDHVTFRYPGTERIALQDFSLTLRSKQVAAIVGPNGAGKSTLLKLLCRFYDPEQGEIRVDGVCLRDIPLEQLRRRISALFQQPVHFNSTAKENIWYADLSDGDTGAIETAAKLAGADELITSLPNGFETLLGKQFSEGVELSGGEWQRIATARTFARNAPIILLDEPTSAMDPWSEIRWAEQFRRFAQGRTAVVVTHRFTTAKHADTIYVMAGGQIVEAGTHEELLAVNGLYARGWADQRSEAAMAGNLQYD